jgi:hypothetical protein
MENVPCRIIITQLRLTFDGVCMCVQAYQPLLWENWMALNTIMKKYWISCVKFNWFQCKNNHCETYMVRLCLLMVLRRLVCRVTSYGLQCCTLYWTINHDYKKISLLFLFSASVATYIYNLCEYLPKTRWERIIWTIKKANRWSSKGAWSSGNILFNLDKSFCFCFT